MIQTLEELREEARSLGLRVHHKHSEETLREMIDAALAEKEPVELKTLTTVHVEPIIPQQDKPVRVLMYKQTGERLWVMQNNVKEYFNFGWMLV